jgi:Tfp pilus assembly protein PilN
MTEIDFIPQWYQAGRNRRLWRQRQVFIICLVAVAGVMWCLAAGRGLSQAQADLTAAYSDFESGIGKIQQREELAKQCSQLQKQAKILDLVVPRTSYSAILAELSCCIGPETVIQKLDIHSEPITSQTETTAPKVKKLNSAVGADKTAGKPAVTQTCIVLTGYTLDAKQVAEMISAIEQSAYFSRVIPTYSKNQKVQERDVTEFEIRCVVADYEIANGKG